MEGLLKLIEFIVKNWTLIIAIAIAICTGIIQLQKFSKKSDEEQLKIVMNLIRETIMDYITRSEFEYEDLVKSGSIKRAQVIKEIFEDYPILGEIVNQEYIIEFIDNVINEGLEELRNIIEQNEDSFVITTREDK